MKNFLLLFCSLLLSWGGLAQGLDGSITPSSPAICSGAAVVLQANATGGTPGYSYFWITTGESGQSITVTTPRTYTVRITDQAGAVKDVSINIAANPTPDAPSASNTSGAVCYNSSARLEATAPSGAMFNWYTDQQGGTPIASGAVFNTPAITANSTIYYVEAVVNGCVSSRTGVAIPLAPNPITAGVTICANTSATLTASGSVDYRWWDSASGGNQVGSGDTFTTPILTTNRTYYLEGITTSGCVTERIAVLVTVTQAPQAPTVSRNPYIICANNSVTLQATGPSGVLFDWFDVEVGGISLITSPDYTTPVLTANKTYWVQSRLNDCVGARTRVEVVVNSPPAVPQATSDGAVCPNSGATLRVANPISGITYRWYESATSLTPLAWGTVFTTPAISANTSFYVRSESASCVSDPIAVEATVSPIIEKPVVSGATLICARSTTTLNISQPNGSYTYEWFDTPNGTTPMQTGVSFTPPSITSNTTFYVQARSGNCTSARTSITITLLPLPPQPTVTPVAAVCYNTSATLAADNGTAYRWYTAPTGGTPISSDRIFTTGPLTSNTSFYVANVVDGCEGDRTRVDITVNTATQPPTVDDPGPAVCRGTALTLHAHSSGGDLQWFSTPTGGNMLFQGPDYTVTANNTTTFYVQVVNGTCTSDRTPVTVEVLPYVATQFQYSNGSYCISSAPQTPTIYVSGGTFAGSPGLQINPITGTIDIAASGIGRYTVFYTTNNGACDITTTADITITLTADADFDYEDNIFCQGGANPRPRFPSISSSGGVFTVDNPGLIINSSTGEIDLAASQPGLYRITNTVNLPNCNSSDVAFFDLEIREGVIVDAGNDRFAPKEDPLSLSGTLSRSAAVTWSTTNGLGVLSNENSLNGASYQPNDNDETVTFILTANDAGTCGPQTDRVTITFINRPAAPVTTTDTVCVGNTATLTAFTPGANNYQWFNVATGGSPIHTGANYTTSALNTVGVVRYWVQALSNGLNGDRSVVEVVVEDPPTTPQVTGDRDICEGGLTNLVATSSNAVTYRWFNADMFPVWIGNTLNVPISTNTSYFVQAEGRDCNSGLVEIALTVKPVPQVTSEPSGEICSGEGPNYTIVADLAGTAFTWTRAAVAAINSNQPGSGSGSLIDEILISSSPNIQTVTYIITPTADGCSGTPFNYTVRVKPTPVLTSADRAQACNDTPLGYRATFSTAVSEFSWSRDAVAGISNISVADQTSVNIREALNNTTNAPVTVIYHLTFATADGCSNTFDLPVTVNPSVEVTSENFTLACSNVPFTYQITSNVSGATFNWIRNAVGSNPAASANGVSSINETLFNSTGQQLDVYYLIIPMYNGCASSPFTYHVIFNPQPAQPVLNANTPVCEDNTLILQTSSVPGATYTWTMPDGSSVDTTDPILNINNVTLANAGNYSLVITVNGCSSVPGTRTVVITRKPTSNAGPDQTVCPSATEVDLQGDVRGGANQQPIAGVWSGGTGTFSSINDLNGKYFPSAQDKANGSVTLTLTSASPDDCTPAVSQVLITFDSLQVAAAGPDQTVCTQEANVSLSGTIAPGRGNPVWSIVSGSGSFDATNQSATIYHPDQADFAAGFVILRLSASAPGPCDRPDDEIRITFEPLPTATADRTGVRYVLEGGSIILNPTVSDENVTYQWSPATGLSDPTAKSPVVTGGNADITYTLIVTNALGCSSEPSSVTVRVSVPLSAPNTFTPNADGYNDVWLIQGIEAYPNAIVNIYSRDGQVVFRSVGYAKPWDGTSNGKPVPFGTYYYVIDARELEQRLSGYVAVVR